MTKRVGGALLVAALAVVVPAAVMAGSDGAASVAFGDPDVGSPGPVGPPPIEIHDSSINAQFNLVPRTVVVSAPGVVTFTVSGPQDRRLTPVPHQVAVCKAGIGPDDVVIANPTALFINDPNCPAHGAPSNAGAVVPVQFTEPGRYLVICNIRPHFTEFNMYGWVIVK